jgi:hypothetical protein
MSDKNDRAIDGVQRSLRGGDVLGQRRRRVLDGNDRDAFVQEEGDDALPTGPIRPGSMHQDDGRL